MKTIEVSKVYKKDDGRYYFDVVPIEACGGAPCCTIYYGSRSKNAATINRDNTISGIKYRHPKSNLVT